MTLRGEICWVDLEEPQASLPANRRPILVVQSDQFNTSRLATTMAVVVTSNTSLAAMPGNVFLPAAATGLPRDSVANVTAVVTVDKADLSDVAGQVPPYLMQDVDAGLRRVFQL